MSEPAHVAGQLDLAGQEVPRPNPDAVWVDVQLSVRLTPAEAWGGPTAVPQRWTLETLADEVEARYAGDLPGWLRDWNLADHAEVTLTTPGRTAHLRGL